MIKFKRLLTALLLLFVVVEFFALARPGGASAFMAYMQQRQTPRSGSQAPKTAKKSGSSSDGKLVYMRADRSYSIEVGDSMAVCMVGNFAALHNGAVITCDSAVRYDAQTIECFGNVLINQNTTFIYGDRADYQGRTNKAEVYSPLIKVIDGDATLYTHRFTFDTYEEVGEFERGGVLFNKGNQLEADHGYYYSQSHELSCVGDVQMRDTTYLLTSDSVLYNTDTDRAYFFKNTHIWNDTGDYLYGDRGLYDRPQELYTIFEQGYILTEKDELWSDSLDYYRGREFAILRNNIQIDDTEHKLLAFGDYAEYLREPGDALLTRLPSVVSYDTEQGDSLFMRSDTIILLTNFTTRPEYNPWGPKTLDKSKSDSLKRDTVTAVPTESNEQVGLQSALPALDEGVGEQSKLPKGGDKQPSIPAKQKNLPASKPEDRGQTLREGGTQTDMQPSFQSAGDENEPQIDIPSTPREAAEAALLSDSLQLQEFENQGDNVLDSLAADSVSVDSRDSLQRLADSLDTLSKDALKSYYKRIKKEEKERVKAQKEAERAEKLKIIARARQAKITAQLNRMDSLEKLRLERRRERMQSRLEAKRQKAIARGKELPDSTELARLDSLISQKEHADTLATDNLTLDSLKMDSLAIDSLAADSLKVDPDTIRRVLYGYRNVRIFRPDFQAVCDSMVGIGVDSTLHLFIDPVIWNEQHQVSSDVVDIYTKNQALDHADFTGTPIMVSAVDTSYFNQISGKEMTAWFRDNEIYRHDVNGNVETIYFIQDDPDAPVNDMFIIRSGTASFYIENRQVVSMTYREQNEYSMFPMNKLPESQELFLKNYKWVPERRPARDSVQTRTIRPSLRDEKGQLDKPSFPITDRIMMHKSRLIDSGKWADRDEELAPDVQEWVRRNGYVPSAPR